VRTAADIAPSVEPIDDVIQRRAAEGLDVAVAVVWTHERVDVGGDDWLQNAHSRQVSTSRPQGPLQCSEATALRCGVARAKRLASRPR
jgi:hypothetical protein